MRKLTKSVLAIATILSVGSVGLLGTAATHAASDSSTNLVDKIATTFKLNKADVQKVFDQDQAEHEATRQAEISTKLQKLVDAGTITAAQKTTTEAKLKELQAAREADKDSMQDLTNDQRKAKMDSERTALQSWATTNGIDLSKLQGIFMGGRGGPR